MRILPPGGLNHSEGPEPSSAGALSPDQMPRVAKELALSFFFGCGLFGAAHWCGLTLPTTNDRVQKHKEAKQQQAD